MKSKFFMIIILSASLLVAIFVFVGITGSKQSVEEAQDIKNLVHQYSTRQLKAANASITSDELIVTKSNSEEEVYPLPEDEFFVSIAPYLAKTHKCAIHSLTGCQGELTKKDFHVFITNEDGEVVVDEMMQSYENGFIDLWLPRNEKFHVKITFEGKSSEQEISTYKGDNTCITTMQLF